MIDCLKCINSGCCKLIIEIDRKEYNRLKPEIQKEFELKRDIFLNENPRFKKVIPENELDNIFSDIYAVMKKENDGYCKFLNRKTMLCSVYEDRPNVCKDYTNTRCHKIREICQAKF